MENTCKISIITPTLNQAQFIEKTIKSVLDQEADFPFEYIVVDGGSTDGTLDILKKYEGKIRWFSEKDRGQSDAINKGIALARGEIVAWLNSDDIYLPGALQAVGNHFDSFPQQEWLYGNCLIIDKDDQLIRPAITLYKKILALRFNQNVLLVENFLSQPAVFFKREVFFRVGKLSESLHFAMDYDLWIRLAKKGIPIQCKQDLACFRLHNSSKSTMEFKQLFREQFNIHRLVDHRRSLLAIHRLAIFKTLIIYHALRNIERLKSNE